MPPGVITVGDVDYGTLFGPFPDSVGAVEDKHYIGLSTADRLRSEGKLKIRVSETASLDWLSSIQPARNEDEQNMEAYMKQGRIYYRTLRIVKSGEELLVWYSKDFCQYMSIPDVRRLTNVDKEFYVCNFCGDTFEHVYPLRAHIRFQCDTSSFRQTSTKNSTFKFTSSTQNVSQRKRRHEEDMILASPVDQPSDTVILESSSSGGTSQKTDINSNSKTDQHFITEAKGSAFRRVEKCEFPAAIPLRSNNSSENVSVPINVDSKGIPSDMAECPSSMSRLCNVETYGLPMVIPNTYNNMSNFIHSPKVPIRDTLGSIRFRAPFEPVAGSIDSFPMDTAKHLLLSNGFNAGVPYMKSTNPMVEKILHSSSPSTLNTPIQAMNLAQNWCAKCNASFRMTSDLVYHMRSHHKREFDPIKKKRDDKLKCNICQETFRERHHLTRHMTSHA